MKELYLNGLFLVGLLEFLLGMVIIIKNRKPAINFAFFLLAIFGAIWTFEVKFLIESKSMKMAYFWDNNLAIVAVAICTTLYYLSLTLKYKNFKEYAWRVILSYCLVILFSLLSIIPHFFVKDIVFHEWGKHSVLNIGYYLVEAIFSIYSLIFIFTLISTYKNSDGTKRNQIKYFLWSITPSLTLGAIFNSFLVLAGNCKYVWVGPLCASIMVVVMFYAIFAHKLMDIDLAWKKGANYLLYFISGLFIFTVIGYKLKNVKFGIELLVGVCFIFAPILHAFADKHLKPLILGRKYEYFKALDKLLMTGEVAYTSHEILGKLIADIDSAMKNLNNISVFMYHKGYKKFLPITQIRGRALGYDMFTDFAFDEGSPIIKLFEQEKLYLLRSDLVRNFKENYCESAAIQLGNIDAEVAIPLFNKKLIASVVFIGRKTDGSLFHSEDVEKLKRIVRKAEQSLSHAIFMETRSLFSRGTAHDVKNYIGHTTRSYEYLMDEHDPVKKEELLVDFGKELYFLQDVFNQIFNMTILFNKITTNQYEIAKMDFAEVVKDTVIAMTAEYKKNGIELRMELGHFSHEIFGNVQDLRRVLNNLTGNALKFTKQGYVLIKTEKEENDDLKVIVKDTGVGIPKSRMKDLWAPFMYGEKSSMDRMRDGEGTGLGLPIVRDIIEAHKGRIWVETEEGVGTSFCFVLKQDKEEFTHERR